MSNLFPSDICPENKDNFNQLYYIKVLKELRQTISHHVLRSLTYDEYFAIDVFFEKYQKYISPAQIVEMVKLLREELEALGWKTQLSFGDTGLFIFIGDKPRGCW